MLHLHGADYPLRQQYHVRVPPPRPENAQSLYSDEAAFHELSADSVRRFGQYGGMAITYGNRFCHVWLQPVRDRRADRRFDPAEHIRRHTGRAGDRITDQPVYQKPQFPKRGGQFRFPWLELFGGCIRPAGYAGGRVARGGKIYAPLLVCHGAEQNLRTYDLRRGCNDADLAGHITQLAFAAAILCVALVVSKHLNQSERSFGSVRTELDG